MKRMLKVSVLCAACLVLFSAMTCSTQQQKIAYQTIGTTETLVLNANNAYLDAVVTGAAPTNDTPRIEAMFNDTQMALRLAAVTASMGTNAPTPAAVQVKANTFISAAATATATPLKR